MTVAVLQEKKILTDKLLSQNNKRVGGSSIRTSSHHTIVDNNLISYNSLLTEQTQIPLIR